VTTPGRPDWQETLRAFAHPRVITMLFLGFSAGLPILLIFSSLSLWLREADVSRSAVTFFSWAALGYSFKFVWAPLIDKLPIPILKRLLGRRRSWLLVAQLSVILAILWMSSIDPAGGRTSLSLMALAAVLLGFSSATQDIVIDAYRIESAEESLQALMSSTYIAGYRIGMLLADAGALFLADAFGTAMGAYDYSAWQWAYRIMAMSMGIGILTTLIISEPVRDTTAETTFSQKDSLSLVGLFICVVIGFIGSYILTQGLASYTADLAALFSNQAMASVLIATLRLAIALLAAFLAVGLLVRLNWIDRKLVTASYIDPMRDFFSRYGARLGLLLLALISVYRMSDIVLGIISNVFYQDMGYSKTDIAKIVKTFGLLMTIAGGFLGGILSVRFGVMRILMLGAILGAATNLLFMLLAQGEPTQWALIGVISADNLSAGLASAAFIAFLSSLTNVQFTATQYAIFSSLMTLFPKVLGGYSGSMVDSIGYSSFFLTTALLGLPAIILILLARNRLELAPVAFKSEAA
jgi:PAT family beta-lactamase induction signal transducer AmpG